MAKFNVGDTIEVGKNQPDGTRETFIATVEAVETIAEGRAVLCPEAPPSARAPVPATAHLATDPSFGRGYENIFGKQKVGRC